MICHMLFYMATHTDSLFILLLFLLLDRIRYRKTAIITANKTATPTVIPMIIPVEFNPLDILVSVTRKWYDSNALKYKVSYLSVLVLRHLLANHKGCQHKYNHPVQVFINHQSLNFNTVNKLHTSSYIKSIAIDLVHLKITHSLFLFISYTF